MNELNKSAIAIENGKYQFHKIRKCVAFFAYRALLDSVSAAWGEEKEENEREQKKKSINNLIVIRVLNAARIDLYLVMLTIHTFEFRFQFRFHFHLKCNFKFRSHVRRHVPNLNR